MCPEPPLRTAASQSSDPGPAFDPAAAPCFVVQNAGSGQQQPSLAAAALERALLDAGRGHRLWRVSGSAALQSAAREAVGKACAAGGFVVAAGGDGTVNAVVTAALGSGCPVGVLPQGTFNFFSRTHGIPDEVDEAVRVLLQGSLRRVPVGLVNERVFLVNASLGLYPKLIEDREAYYASLAGRHRVTALWAGLGTLLREHRQLRLQLEQDGRSLRTLRTPTVFVGNNRLQLEQIGIPQAAEVDGGRLAVIALRRVGTWSMLGLLLRGALGRLGDADQVLSFSAQELTVRPAHRYGMARAKVGIDGEIDWMKMPLRFRVSPLRLPLIAPQVAASDRDGLRCAGGAGA